jgi:hypothetical protein
MDVVDLIEATPPATLAGCAVKIDARRSWLADRRVPTRHGVPPADPGLPRPGGGAMSGDIEASDARGDLEDALTLISGLASVLLGMQSIEQQYLGGQLREHYQQATTRSRGSSSSTNTRRGRRTERRRRFVRGQEPRSAQSGRGFLLFVDTETGIFPLCAPIASKRRRPAQPEWAIWKS